MSDLDNEELKATRELNKNKYKNARIFGVKNKDNDETLKIHIPLLTKEEKREIENNLESIVGKYIHTIVHEKDLAISQYVIIEQEKYIKQLETDNKKKDKIIDEMAEMINNYDIDEDICKQMGNRINCNEFADKEKCKECIKQYFKRKVGKK